MISLKEVAAAFLTYKKWPIFATPDPHLFCTQFQGDNGTWNVFIQCHPEQPIALIHSLFPQQCPPEKESQMLYLLAKLNDGLMIGNFEYNFTNREILFKTALNATHMPEKLNIFDAPFYYNFLAMDNHFKEIQSLL